MDATPIKFTITAASDWPMFQWMFTVLLSIMGTLWTIIVGLIIYIHRDLKKRITTQRSDDGKKCDNCHSELKNSDTEIWDHIDKAVWVALDQCCPRRGHEPAQEMVNRRRRHA